MYNRKAKKTSANAKIIITRSLTKTICYGLIIFVFISFVAVHQLAQAAIDNTDKSRIDQELAKDENKISGKAIVLIYADSDWSGAIEGSDSVSATKEGSGDAKLLIECKNGFFGLDKGIYSLNIQKGTETGHLTVAVIQNGNLLKGDTTTARFGIVGFAGECG